MCGDVIGICARRMGLEDGLYTYTHMCVCACVNARKFFVAVLFVVGKKHVDKCGNYSIPCSLRINAPLIDDCINL